MAVDCTGKLNSDIAYSCITAPVGGIEQNILLINKDDIASVTYAADTRLKLTDISLKSGKTGYLLTGIKQANGKAWELVKKDNAPDKFKQTFSGVIFNPSLANKEQADNLSKGGKYVAIVEQVWKGTASADAFEVLGVEAGLELMTMTNNSKENDNMIMFELASADGFEEPTMPKTLLMTDYATTKTAFTNKLAES